VRLYGLPTVALGRVDVVMLGVATALALHSVIASNPAIACCRFIAVAYRGGPKLGVPGTIVPGGPLPPVDPPASGVLDPPRDARTIPPTAAPPTTAAIATHLDRFDLPGASALVCDRVALADSPRDDAVTRMRNCPSTRFGTSPRPIAMPRLSVWTVRLNPLSPKVALGPEAGSRKETVAFARGSPEGSRTWTAGSCPRRRRMLLMALSPWTTRSAIDDCVWAAA